MRFLSYLFALILLSACGGGGGNNPPPVPVNVAPTISAVPDQQVDGNGQVTIVVSVADDSTSPDDLMVSASSSNSALLPDPQVSTQGDMRNVDLVPSVDELGTSEISLTVTDAQGLTSTVSFNVSVTPVSQSLSQFVRDAFAAGESGSVQFINALEFVDDVQDDDFSDLLPQ